MRSDDNILPPGHDPANRHGFSQDEKTAVSSTSKNQPISQTAGDAFAAEKKKPRTLGLKLFDLALYPFLTNFVVFGMSVGTTYLSSHALLNDPTGHKKDRKYLLGKLGGFFYERGEKVRGFFQNTLGRSESTAKNANMVFWSYVDGTLISPLVKLLEDRREVISRWVDDKLGTAPDDLSVYDAEPKQSWASVIGGRLATASLVVPTAILLNNIPISAPKMKNGEMKPDNLNDFLFHNPGAKAGRWVAENKPGIVSRFPNLKIPELFSTGFFEFVYTGICTAGLYISSRLFARWGENKHSAENTGAKDANGHPELSYGDRDIRTLAKTREAEKANDRHEQETVRHNSFSDKASVSRRAIEQENNSFAANELSKRMSKADAAYQAQL